MILSSDLKKAICYKIGKFNTQDLSEEDIAKIEDIDLSGTKLNGEKSDIDLREISRLQNLKHIMLKSFELNDEVITYLNSMPQLESLYLSYCSLNSNIPLANGKVDSLTINGCRIPDYSLLSCAKKTTFINAKKLKLNKLMNKELVESLRLIGCDIQNVGDLLNYPLLAKLQFEGTKVDNPRVIDQLSSKIEVTETENQYPIR